MLFSAEKLGRIGFSQSGTIGICWIRTAERQASRLRARYLKAVLRQKVGYFDLHVTSISKVITSFSGESLVIQDVISENVFVFLAAEYETPNNSLNQVSHSLGEEPRRIFYSQLHATALQHKSVV